MLGELRDEKFCAGRTICMSRIGNGDLMAGHRKENRSVAGGSHVGTAENWAGFRDEIRGWKGLDGIKPADDGLSYEDRTGVVKV